jgi:hypothetical protein
MRKGIAIPIGGMIMISISIIVLFILTLGSWNETRYVTFRGESLMSVSHEVELTRKMTDQSSYFIAQRAAYEIGLIGGGSQKWTVSDPTVETLRDNLISKVEGMLLEGTYNSSYSGRKITWMDKSLMISGYDASPCGSLSDSTCFHLAGTQKFKVTDDTIKAEVTSSIPFDQYVDSSYFRLIAAGREILENTAFNTLFNDPTTLATNLNSDPRFSGLEFKLTEDGNKLDIEIIDKSCFPPSSTGKMYCLAPVAKGELDPADQLSDGGVIPFDYLRLKFSVDVISA